MTNERLIEIAEEVVRLIMDGKNTEYFLCYIPSYDLSIEPEECIHWEGFIQKYKPVSKNKLYSGEYWYGGEAFWDVIKASRNRELDELMQVKADFLIEAIFQETGHRIKETKK